MVALLTGAEVQRTGESLLVGEENAYNPIPSPDGAKIAFVRTGWGRGYSSFGSGRSSLRSDVLVSDTEGRLLTPEPIADAFVAGWTPDSKQLICFRDWRYFLVTLDGSKRKAGTIQDQESRPERVHYLPKRERFVWVERDFGDGVIRDSSGEKVARFDHVLSKFIAPSPDERYLAVIAEGHLTIFDTQLEKWADLGPVTIHPYHEWDYIKPSWNPWFANSSAVAFVSGDSVVVASPDGKDRRVLCTGQQHAGLAAAAPNGRRVAYVTFTPRPSKFGANVTFWGDARVWVVPLAPGSEPRPMTQEHANTIYELRWLGDQHVVFDRLSDVPFLGHARLWKARID